MSAAKVIKIYRHTDSRLGFVCNDIPCEFIDKPSLLQFIRGLNKSFLSCENDKNMSLFAIDRADEDFVLALCLALVAPLIMYALFGHPDLIMPLYCGVMVFLAYKVTMYLAQLNIRKREFQKGEQILWESFAEQQKLFRQKCAHLQINYFESESMGIRGYFQIKTVSVQSAACTEPYEVGWNNLEEKQRIAASE